jgi:hypothetical protein
MLLIILNKNDHVTIYLYVKAEIYYLLCVEGAWQDCSVTCGTGVRLRKITCTLDDETVNDSLCDRGSKPSAIEGCYLPKCYVTTPQTSYRTDSTVWRDSTTQRTTTQRSTQGARPRFRWRTGSWTEVCKYLVTFTTCLILIMCTILNV